MLDRKNIRNSSQAASYYTDFYIYIFIHIYIFIVQIFIFLYLPILRARFVFYLIIISYYCNLLYYYIIIIYDLYNFLLLCYYCYYCNLSFTICQSVTKSCRLVSCIVIYFIVISLLFMIVIY